MKHVFGLAFVLIVVAFAFLAGRWIEEHYVSRPEIEPATGPFHNPGYRQRAENAVRRFSALPAAEQAALRSDLEENIISFARWLDRIGVSQIKVLCLGEDHEDPTRQFLARKFFSELDIDVLLLEVTPTSLGGSLRSSDGEGSGYLFLAQTSRASFALHATVIPTWS